MFLFLAVMLNALTTCQHAKNDIHGSHRAQLEQALGRGRLCVKFGWGLVWICVRLCVAFDANCGTTPMRPMGLPSLLHLEGGASP